jgi:hypothetical protein
LLTSGWDPLAQWEGMQRQVEPGREEVCLLSNRPKRAKPPPKGPKKPPPFPQIGAVMLLRETSIRSW